MQCTFSVEIRQEKQWQCHNKFLIQIFASTFKLQIVLWILILGDRLHCSLFSI